MGLSASTLAALEKKWFETPSPIQEACIPLLLDSDKDIIWQAQTGTGKTAAFAIPVIEQIKLDTKHIQAVIMAPTRELAIQIATEIDSLKGTKRIKVVQVYGGAPIGKQLKELSAWAHIVVGTPGRMIDFINRGKLKLGNVDFCILDEADEMLNMWFLDEIEAILDVCNEEKQMLCFSATMPKAIKRVAERYMNDVEMIKVAASQLTTGNTEQLCMHVRGRDKLEALTRVMDSWVDFYGIVFCKTKRGCDELVSTLQANDYHAGALHGDMNQKQREQMLKKFKKKKITILVATDVAARGIDVDDLSHVVNYDMPQDTEAYTHRIGRTWRAGKKWIALSFVTKKDQRKIRTIERVTKGSIEKIDVPTIESVIHLKKSNIITQIKESIPTETSPELAEMMKRLSDEGSDQEIIAGLLTIAFWSQLDPSSYTAITPGSSGSYDAVKEGYTRLFVARGRMDGMKWPRELVERLEKETKVPQHIMDDIAIRDSFSFITCPTPEAETIIDIFKDKPWRTLVSISKDKWGGGWGKKGKKGKKGKGKGRFSGKNGEKGRKGGKGRSGGRREKDKEKKKGRKKGD